MSHTSRPKLNPKKRYLQIALNSTLEEAYKIIAKLPVSDRIIVEAGTPFIKRYGEQGIRQIRRRYEQHIARQMLAHTGNGVNASSRSPFSLLFYPLSASHVQRGGDFMLRDQSGNEIVPYIVADLKTMDRGGTEVAMAAQAGASAAVALGHAPIETLNSFIEECERLGLDSMVDMMNVDFPLYVLRALKKQPHVVILHRGVDEELFNREKQLPLHEIQRIKSNYRTMVAVAGGDTVREVQRAVFNDADIVVIWKSVFQDTNETIKLVNGFLEQVR